MPFDYGSAFRDAINSLAAGQTIDLDELLAIPGLPAVGLSTKRNHLRRLVQAEPQLLERIVGFYPSVATVIDLVEQRHGLVTEARINEANEQCKEIVGTIARPIVHRFVRTALDQHINGANVALTLDELMQFLLEEFVEFQRGAGNGLVSIAGGMNEALLMRAMSNAGLVRGTDFKKTGTNSEGDFVVHSRVGTRENLGVEVKSYHARERLLRGLRDITGLKVGAGYFRSPAEFNAARTMTLLQADPAAIYMPRVTLEEVDGAARAMTTNNRIAFQRRLYRPLEQFVTDMSHYTNTGQLP